MDKGFGSKFQFNEKNKFYIRIGLWPVRFLFCIPLQWRLANFSGSVEIYCG